MAVDPETKAHPDYSDGYWDALDGTSPPPKPSPQYVAGRDAAARASDLLKGSGFQQDGRTFTKSLTIGERK